MLLLAAGAARAERPKILVLPVAGKVADAGFRDRVAQALSEGVIASGGEVVAQPSGAAALPAEGCTTPACLAGAARATGAALLLRAVVEEEGRSYAFKLEMLDGQSGAVLAQRENRCEICTDAEALEIANAAASALKAQALKKPGPQPVRSASTAAAAPEHPVGPRARVTVVDRLELPASLGEFHGKLQAALEALVREQGLEVVAEPAIPATCGSTNCGEELLAASGASHVLFVEGSRNDYGFSLDLTLRGVSGDESEKAQGWCNFCTGPQMVTAAENVARPLIVHLAVRPERASGSASGTAGGPGAAADEGKRSSGVARVLFGAGLAAVGAASVVVGSVTWHRAGEQTDCFGTGSSHDCAQVYGGRNLGIGMVAGGAILTGVGAYLMIFTGSKTTVAAGPGGVSVAGKF
jgi:hypothetical protein